MLRNSHLLVQLGTAKKDWIKKEEERKGRKERKSNDHMKTKKELSRGNTYVGIIEAPVLLWNRGSRLFLFRGRRY